MPADTSRTAHPLNWLKARFFSSSRLTLFMSIALILMLVILIAIAIYVAARPPSSDVPFISWLEAAPHPWLGLHS